MLCVRCERLCGVFRVMCCVSDVSVSVWCFQSNVLCVRCERLCGVFRVMCCVSDVSVSVVFSE